MSSFKKSLVALALASSALMGLPSAHAAYVVVASGATLAPVSGYGAATGAFSTDPFDLGGLSGTLTVQITADSLSPLYQFFLYTIDGTSPLAPTGAGTFTGNTLTYTYTGLLGGSQKYVADIFGTANAKVNLSFSATSAVPEASTTALTLAGLGVVGMVASRRRRAV